MEDNFVPNPVVQALKTIFGRSDTQLDILKGRKTTDPNRPIGDSLEEQLSKAFLGQTDLSHDRLIMYRDYDRMDAESSECQTALDIYSEEAAEIDQEKGFRIWIESEDKDLENSLNTMLLRIKMESKIQGIYRNLAKYGDVFLYLVLGAYGVHDTQFIHPSRIERKQEDGLLGFKSQQLSAILPMDNKNGLFAPWSFIHYRVRAFDQESLYGRSILASLRKLWRQISMLESMLVLFRIAKSVQRSIFYVDVGQSPTTDIVQLQKEYEKLLKNKTAFIDPVTKEYRTDFNPVTLMQDIIWPTRPGSTSRVEYLQNTSQIGPIHDLDYFRNKLRSGLGIPKSYFDGEIEGALFDNRTALALQDLRFKRKILKFQQAVIEGTVRLCQIHLAITTGQYVDPGSFAVKIGTNGSDAEFAREQVLVRKGQILVLLSSVADSMNWNKRVWSDYLLDQVYPLEKEIREALFTPDPSLLYASIEGMNAIDKLKKETDLENVDPALIQTLIQVATGKKTPGPAIKRGKGSFAAPGGNLSTWSESLTKEEFNALVAQKGSVAMRLDETKSDWKSKVNWDELHKAGKPPEQK